MSERMSDEERSGDGKALCLWCGEALPLRTPETAGQIIEHLGRCQKHPTREALDRAQGAEAREEGLRDALAERINRIVALELERDSALARVEALEAALGRIKGRAEAQPVHVCGVADFDLQVIAREASQALRPTTTDGGSAQ